jgi:hypothetical protein
MQQIEPTSPTSKNPPEQFAGDVWHFQAAAEDTFMEHIAMLESGDDPATTTTWLEHITDADYDGR